MYSFRSSRTLRCVILSAATLWANSALAQVQGAGASFPSKVYERWAQAFEKKAGGTKVSYRATGSGDGVRQVSSRAVQFGGTDRPLSAEELARHKLVQLPMLVGGVVPVVNLPGVAPQRLRLDGELLAALMSGQISHWNDARIAALNPGLALPALPVRRVVRAEPSGTTEALTQYLSLVSSAFKAEVGASLTPKWPGAVQTAEGSDGVVREFRAQPGSITYVSYDRAVQERLATVQLRNAAGEFVAAGETGFRAAILESDLVRRNDDRASLLNRPGRASWPITLTSFVLVDAQPATADGVVPALRFLYWCFVNGDRLTENTGFAPLPISVQAQLTARFDAVRDPSGQPLKYQAF